MFMLTTKDLIQHGIPQKADELIERMREACRRLVSRCPRNRRWNHGVQVDADTSGAS